MSFKTRVQAHYQVVAAPNRKQALEYVGHVITPDGKKLPANSINPKTAILVGWQCGFEPMYVAIQDEDGDELSLSDIDAEDIAKKYLTKINWFSEEDEEEDDDGSESGNQKKDCDYIHMPTKN
jgi:hypothetical protein